MDVVLVRYGDLDTDSSTRINADAPFTVYFVLVCVSTFEP